MRFSEPMLAHLRDFYEPMIANELYAHLFTVAGFILAIVMVAKLMGERRAPANTFAWLLVIVLVPFVGVPLYLIFGGRKLRRLAENKAAVCPVLPGAHPGPSASACLPVAATLSAVGACPPIAGNCLTLLTTGESEFEALEAQIRSAKHTIHITTFILSRDPVGKRVVDLLAERAREGVKVRLLLDAVGSFVSSRSFVDPIRQAGGEVGRFMPVMFFTSRGSANLRNHRKIAVFDHTRAILGGRNIAKEYMGPLSARKPWRDFGTLIEGPAATLLNEIFIEDWCFATRQSPEKLRSELPPDILKSAGNCELQVVASGPDVRGDPLYEGILSMIQEAEKSVTIVTPYFIPDDVLLRSLIVKARAGRQVTLVVPAQSNHPITDYARRYYTRQLIGAGGHLKLYGPGMLHAKAVIVDDKVALYGSPNFDLRSLFVNFEVGVFVHSRRDVEAISAWAQDLLKSCREPLLEIDGRHHVVRSIAEELSRLMAPLL